MRKASLIFGFFVCFCFNVDAWAEKGKPANLDEIIGAYAGVGTNFQNSGSFNLGFKVRALKYCPVGMEFVYMAPYGSELAFPLYLINHPNFKFHVILPYTGFYFRGMKRQISVDWLERKEPFDIVIGAGIEIQVDSRRWFKAVNFNYFSVTLDWRGIGPDPVWVSYNYADFGRAIYRQAAKEGQIWLGITFWY